MNEEKLQQDAALNAFRELFSAFRYPFASSDAKLDVMESGERAMYYEKSKGLIENDVWKQEIEEWKRHFYETLALSSINDMERTAYHVVLIAIKYFEKRLTTLATRVKQVQITKLVDRL